MDLATAHVTVVGAGIGGMATSLLLSRAGARVTLVERAEQITAVGAGILLQPNGLAVLTGLGLDGPLRRSGYRATATAVRAADGSVVSDLAVPDFGAGLDQMLAVRRSDLHAVLHDAVRADAAITCRLGTAVGSADASGTVTVPSGTVAADLVVGCDGIRSAVRGTGDFGARIDETGQVYLRGLVPRQGADLLGEYWTPLGLFGGAPVDDATQYFYASATAPAVRAAVAARDLGDLQKTWGAVLPAAVPVLDAVQRFDDLLVNDVVRVDCARWHDGRRVLLGDAAHAMAPTAGQGANSALVDAAVLVAELATGKALDEALPAYTARRLPAVKRVQDQADRLTRLAHLRSPLARLLRDTALRVVGGQARVAERLVRSSQQEDPAALRAVVVALDRR